MADPLVSTTTGIVAAVTTTAPGGIAVGDAAWLVVTSSSASATFTTPTGWTRLQSAETVADFSAWLLERDGGWQAGDSAPSFSFSTAVSWAADFISKDGIDLTVPTVSNKTEGATATTVCAVVPTAADSWIFNHGQVDATGSQRTWTSDAGIEFLDRVDNQLHRGAYFRQLSGGAGVSQSTTLTYTGTVQDVASFAWAAAPLAAGPTAKFPLRRRIPRLTYR